MKVVKCCGCSRNIHIFHYPINSADNKKCLFCGNSIDANMTLDIYDKPFLFLNEILSEIDMQINSSQFEAAKKKINNVLEIMPGPKIGETLNSGEIYWRKLLAEVGCKNDIELLSNGRSLEDYTAFTNAKKYANETEKPVYALINKTKNSIVSELIKALKNQEFEKKRATGIEAKLNEYQTDFKILQQRIQEDFLLLENIENDIHMRAIDYAAVIGEYQHTVDVICSDIEKTGATGEFISREERDALINQLEFKCSQCDQEIKMLKELEPTNEHYLEYFRLTEKQENLISDIREKISQIDNIRSKTQSLLGQIEQITNEYSEAVADIKTGDYVRAKELITPSRFDQITEQIMSQIKL